MCVCEMTDVRLEEAVTVCVYVPLLTMMTTTGSSTAVGSCSDSSHPAFSGHSGICQSGDFIDISDRYHPPFLRIFFISFGPGSCHHY